MGIMGQRADTWFYIAEDNERFTFDSNGRLSGWADTSGTAETLSYGNGQVTVTSNTGQSLVFTEDAQHQPLSLSAEGTLITYIYNANQRLAQLKRTRGDQINQRFFLYEDTRNNGLLTGITDERGVRFATWSYDDQGRAISSENSGGAGRIQMSYNVDGSSTVTNELGKDTVYTFLDFGGV